MRKEASLEEWERLYDIAFRIKNINPWQYFSDFDIITISLPKVKQPFYCSVMGQNRTCCGIGIYAGFDAVNGFYKIADNFEIPHEQLIRYQNCNMFYIGRREELTVQELQLVHDLNLEFNDENEYIYFRNFKSGYYPYMLDREQVIQTAEVLKQLLIAVHTFIERKIKVNFDGGNTLFRKYDRDKKKYITFENILYAPKKELPMTIIEDELLIAKLDKKDFIEKKLEVDILYLDAVVNNKNYDRPIIPKVYAAADSESGIIIEKGMLTPNDEGVEQLLCAIINYIILEGKPKTIYVRDDYIESMLTDLCNKLYINLKIKEDLNALDAFVSTFNERAANI